MKQCCFMLALLLSCLAGAKEDAPAFTARPVAVRDGDKVKISFGVNRHTDVTVCVQNAKGDIVRHLVAGVLGNNPPAPLKADSLEQTLEWDLLNDDRKPASGGPFKIHVSLGLKAAWGGQAFADKAQSGPNQIGGGGVHGLATGSDGRLYVLSKRGGKVHWKGMWVMHAFRRDGSYEQTIKPAPSHLSEDRLKAVGAFRNANGDLTPQLFDPLNMTFYPYVEVPQQMAMTPQGHLLLAVRPFSPDTGSKGALRPGVHLAVLDREGGIPFPDYAGPRLDEKQLVAEYPFLASSADGQAVYLTGLATSAKEDVNVAAAVYRAPLPQRGAATVFFGDPNKEGNDAAHLSNPQGVATDGKGHLLVADHGNDRIVILKEADGSFVGSMPVEKPSWLAVHSKTGAVYVESGDSIIKFSGWKEAREAFRMDGIKKLLTPKQIGSYTKYLRFKFALDSSADPAVLWLGCNSGPKPLLRCEDLGDKFSAPQPAGCYSSSEFWNLSAEPAERKLVSCRIEPPWIGANWTKHLHILDEESGTVRQVSPKPDFTHQGTIYRMGPGGQIFSMSVLASIARHDRNGKFLPYDTVADPDNGQSAQSKKVTKSGLMENTPTGSSGWTRDFWVARTGDVYVHHRTGGGGALITIDRLSGATGRFVETVVGQATRNAIGPRLDPAGNIYLAECLKPKGQLIPDAFENKLNPQLKNLYAMQYGSVVKFGPAGGAVEWPVKEAESIRKIELPGSAKTETVPGHWYTDLFQGKPRLSDAVVRGAQWVSPAFSKIGRPYCFCLTTDFDVDSFGRTFYPDLLQFRVGVLDTNGNEIISFGGYGNQDCCGPESYVMDPEGKFLRPRRPGDPDNLPSPAARPEIGFNWISGLAVTEKYAYVADEVNRRVLRVKLEYAATEMADVR